MDSATKNLISVKESLRLLPAEERRTLRLDVANLCAGYASLLAAAPSRAQGYLSERRTGITSSGTSSNRAEEHLAAALFGKGLLDSADQAPVKLLDYQFPLKSVRADAGIGKVDLLGVGADGILTIIELKVDGNREDCRVALLEGLIYAAIIERNAEQIADEIAKHRGLQIKVARPRILVVAPLAYWSKRTPSPELADLLAVASALRQALPIEVELLCLSGIALASYGLNGTAPQLDGHPLLTRLPEPGEPPLMPPPLRTGTYAARLLEQLWAYQRTAFTPEEDLFDSVVPSRSRPPVFRAEHADRNILIPPDADVQTVASIVTSSPARERHTKFTSMRSSQALAQSVFGNLAVRRRLDALEGLACETGEPAFYESATSQIVHLEHKVSTLGEPRPTSVDALFTGPRRIAVEVKLAEAEFGRCSRPTLKPSEPNYERDHCTGSFSIQRGRRTRCSLWDRGIVYWQFVPALFDWESDRDHERCPVGFSYQIVRNLLAACVNEQGALQLQGAHALVLFDDRNPAFQPDGEADLQWQAAIRALRYPHLLRRVSWQNLARHLGQFADLRWLVEGLRDKYGIQ